MLSLQVYSAPVAMASTLKEAQFNQEAITVGKKRQLFNDDFVIARQEGLHRQQRSSCLFSMYAHMSCNLL